jgi:hypothetical protein
VCARALSGRTGELAAHTLLDLRPRGKEMEEEEEEGPQPRRSFPPSLHGWHYRVRVCTDSVFVCVPTVRVCTDSVCVRTHVR